MNTRTTETTTTHLTLQAAADRIRQASCCSADVIEQLDDLYNRGLINYLDARTLASWFAVEWV